MAQKIVGVDLGAHHIKVAVVSAGIRGVQVVDAFEEPVGHVPATDGDDNEVDPLGMVLGVALGALRKRRLLGNPIALVLPPGLLSYRVLSFPFADERRIAQAVSFEAEGQFPVPLEQLVSDHVIVPCAAGGRALIVAARSDRASQIADVFRQAGADVKLVTSGAIASAQIAEPSLAPLSPEGAEKALAPGSLVLEIGHSTTQMIALGAKGPLAVRTMRRGGRHITAAMARAYSLDMAAAEAAKHSDGFVPHRGFDNISDDQLQSGRVVAETIEPIVRELQHTRLWLRSAYDLEIGKIILAGGGADLRGIDEYLAEHIELPVERITPRASLIKGTEGRQWTSMCAALGAAYGLARRPLVQLHEAGVAESDSSWLQERMTSLVAIGVAIMAFGALDTIAQVKALEAEQDAYEEEVAAATLATFGEELLTAAKIDARLASVEGQDLTSLVPERGALELLAMLATSARPTDQVDTPPDPNAGMGLPTRGSGPTFDGEDDEGEDPPQPEGGDPSEPEAPAEPVALEAGIVMADELVFETIDIRKQAIDVRASATASSTQDRFRFRLKQRIGCISTVSNGKVKAIAERKQFDMNIVHNCYYQQQQPQEVEAAADEGEGE